MQLSIKLKSKKEILGQFQQIVSRTSRSQMWNINVFKFSYRILFTNKSINTNFETELSWHTSSRERRHWSHYMSEVQFWREQKNLILNSCWKQTKNPYRFVLPITIKSTVWRSCITNFVCFLLKTVQFTSI